MADTLLEQVEARRTELVDLKLNRSQTETEAAQDLQDERLKRELANLDAQINEEKRLISAQEAANEMLSALEGSPSSDEVPSAPDAPEPPETPAGSGFAEGQHVAEEGDATNNQEGEVQ